DSPVRYGERSQELDHRTAPRRLSLLPHALDALPRAVPSGKDGLHAHLQGIVVLSVQADVEPRRHSGEQQHVRVEEHDPFAARLASQNTPRPLGEVVITLSRKSAKVAPATVAGVRTKADDGPVVNVETVKFEIREELIPLLLKVFAPTCGVVAHQSGLVGKLDALRCHPVRGVLLIPRRGEVEIGERHIWNYLDVVAVRGGYEAPRLFGQERPRVIARPVVGP